MVYITQSHIFFLIRFFIFIAFSIRQINYIGFIFVVLQLVSGTGKGLLRRDVDILKIMSTIYFPYFHIQLT